MKKILYIDDETINLELFVINFRREYDVITTESYQEALQNISEQNISVMVTDYKMPEMNGIELIKKAKKINPNIVCIMLSGYLEREINSESSVVFRNILKPYKKSQLRFVVEEAFDSIKS